MSNSYTLQTKSTVSSNRSLMAMLASGLILALIVIAGALYVQSRQSTDTVTRLSYCNQPRSEWVKLPYRVQVTLAENCTPDAPMK